MYVAAVCIGIVSPHRNEDCRGGPGCHSSYDSSHLHLTDVVICSELMADDIEVIDDVMKTKLCESNSDEEPVDYAIIFMRQAVAAFNALQLYFVISGL